MTSDPIRSERRVIAVSQVFGATTAIASHGDAATLDVARSANAVIRKAAVAVGGRVVKSLGEGLLITFPSAGARDAVAALRAAHEQAATTWRAFDARCELHVKMTIGTVLVGRLGLADDDTEDVWGLTVHQLFKVPAHGFSLSPELEDAMRQSPGMRTS